jgi:hypothetical protein
VYAKLVKNFTKPYSGSICFDNRRIEGCYMLLGATLNTFKVKKLAGNGSGYSLYLFFAIYGSKKKDAAAILCARVCRMLFSTYKLRLVTLFANRVRLI